MVPRHILLQGVLDNDTQTGRSRQWHGKRSMNKSGLRP